MRRTLFLLPAILILACSCGYNAEHMADLYVKANYSDYRETVYCRVDTVTYGDNLNYRIEQQTQRLQDDQRESQRVKANTFLTNDMKAHQLKTLSDSIEKREKVLAGLDSLRNNAGELLNHATAYTVCIAYNQPTNLVWVQMDEEYNLLVIAKTMNKLLLNPGNDIPGYLEVLYSSPSE